MGRGGGDRDDLGCPDPSRRRGARRIFVTSFTFQAPGFYEHHGYVEILRWDGVPVEGQADVHLRKDLG